MISLLTITTATAILISAFSMVYSTTVSNPVITSWTKTTGLGYKSIINNVYKIQYSSSYVYVSTNDIPSYSIGPWVKNDAAHMNFFI